MQSPQIYLFSIIRRDISQRAFLCDLKKKKKNLKSPEARCSEQLPPKASRSQGWLQLPPALNFMPQQILIPMKFEGLVIFKSSFREQLSQAEIKQCMLTAATKCDFKAFVKIHALLPSAHDSQVTCPSTSAPAGASQHTCVCAFSCGNGSGCKLGGLV